MTDITRAKAKAISPDELREQGRRGLTGAEFILLMLGYGEGDS